ncbi:MAG: class I SAM-dependent methyltransferase [Halioglobus sp.]|nr:class I SAM-dependent methyltransferase [Halioglobus sp.]
MATERPHALDADTLQMFASKGTQLFNYRTLEPGGQIPQVGEINAVKVRRVMQLLRDFARGPLAELQVFDFGCAEGVYAIEAALRGVRVKAFDARTPRMEQGRAAAQRLGLANLQFELADIRTINTASHGQADVVLLLGILYHLDSEDLLRVLANVHALCRQFVIIETWVALEAIDTVEISGASYQGMRVREHGDQDTQVERERRLLASMDNSFSFRPTRDSLFAALHRVGFTSICECHLPLYPGMPPDRITLVAHRGEPVALSSYPWINGMSEAQIARHLEDYAVRSRQG